MYFKNPSRAVWTACTIFCFSFFLVLNATAESGLEENEASSEWAYEAMLYGWGPTIKSETPDGHTVEIDLETIVKNLDAIAMAGFDARKGRWTIHSDILFFDISDDESNDITIPVGPFEIEKTIDIEVEMKSWIVNLTGRYQVLETDSSVVAVIAGARYFWLDVGVELDDTTDSDAGEDLSGSDDVWDAVVGVAGRHQLNDRWDVNYKFDVGGGGSKLTWEAVTSVGYDYDWGELQFGYRYTYYDFDSSFKLLSELDVYGPYIAGVWSF